MKAKSTTGLIFVAAAIFMSSCQSPQTQKLSSKQVKAINSFDQLKTIIDSTKDNLLVFDLYADWCAPCKILAPIYDSLATEYKSKATFYRVDIDNNQKIASAFGVQGIPFVVFVKNQEVIYSLTGVNPRAQYEKIINACGSHVSNQECRDNIKNQ